LAVKDETAMKILIDRNIERLSVTHLTELMRRTVKWGPCTSNIDVAQRAYRPPRDDEKFFREELPYFASLCNSARESKVEFFTSFELLMEASRQKGPSQGHLGTDLLQGIPMKRVQCPVQRSVMFGGTASFGITETEQMEFFRSLRHPRFLEIAKAIGDAHIDDAFHLWTAEEASLDVFLTLDKRFRNVVHGQMQNVRSSVLVSTPKELSERLGLKPTDIERLAAEINPFS
jgi:hypothetical protein